LRAFAKVLLADAEHPQKNFLIGGFACHPQLRSWEFWTAL